MIFIMDSIEKISNKDNLMDVSIIVPCRNEEKFIGRCLDSIIAQDYPGESLEVLVVDGMSEDGTREIVERYTDMFIASEIPRLSLRAKRSNLRSG